MLSIADIENLIKERGIYIPEIEVLIKFNKLEIQKLKQYTLVSVLVYAERLGEKEENWVAMDPVSIAYGDELIDRLPNEKWDGPIVYAWLYYLNANYRAKTNRERMTELFKILDNIYSGDYGDLFLFQVAYHIANNEYEVAREKFKLVKYRHAFIPDYNAVSSLLGIQKRFRIERVVSDIIRDLSRNIKRHDSV